MKAFTIDKENNITVYASRKAAIDAYGNAACVFGTEEQLGDLVGIDGKRLVAIWNSLTGVTPVKKFTNSKTGVRRIFAAIQSMEPEAAPASEPVEIETPAKAPRAKRAAKAAGDAGEPRGESKTAQLIDMLKVEGGATLEAIMAKFGWQAHTTRALMSAGGALRKKYGLVVISSKVDGQRTYGFKP